MTHNSFKCAWENFLISWILIALKNGIDPHDIDPQNRTAWRSGIRSNKPSAAYPSHWDTQSRLKLNQDQGKSMAKILKTPRIILVLFSEIYKLINWTMKNKNGKDISARHSENTPLSTDNESTNTVREGPADNLSTEGMLLLLSINYHVSEISHCIQYSTKSVKFSKSLNDWCNWAEKFGCFSSWYQAYLLNMKHICEELKYQ